MEDEEKLLFADEAIVDVAAPVKVTYTVEREPPLVFEITEVWTLGGELEVAWMDVGSAVGYAGAGTLSVVEGSESNVEVGTTDVGDVVGAAVSVGTESPVKLAPSAMMRNFEVPMTMEKARLAQTYQWVE